MTKPLQLNNLPKRVLTGQEWHGINPQLKERKAALPAVCVGSFNAALSVLAAAKEANSPIIALSSFGGGYACAGKTLPDTPEIWAAGATAVANFFHQMAPLYGVTVILSTDHCQLKRLPWVDIMLKEDKNRLESHGQTLWSGHMLDLSEEPLEEALPVYIEYAKKHEALGLMMEYEIGATGGIEDGVAGDASYTDPKDAVRIHSALYKISKLLLAAWSFGNVHGVLKGDFDLQPEILGICQEQLYKAIGVYADLVFHGGSGCTEDQMIAALQHGTTKQNIDTDTQYAYTRAIVDHVRENADRLNSQVGHPGDPTEPNKNFYDPRGYNEKAEQSMTARILESYKWLNSMNLCG